MLGALLTGDAKLKNEATKEGIEVQGIFFIFDELLKHNLIGFSDAIKKLELLVRINNRLPIIEIQKRIEFWEIEKLVD